MEDGPGRHVPKNRIQGFPDRLRPAMSSRKSKPDRQCQKSGAPTMTTRRSRAPKHCGTPACAQETNLPRRAGVGLRPEYFRRIVEAWPNFGFFEVHAEKSMVGGSPMHHYLPPIRDRRPLPIHGVGLSIGGETPLFHTHFAKRTALLDCGRVLEVGSDQDLGARHRFRQWPVSPRLAGLVRFVLGLVQGRILPAADPAGADRADGSVCRAFLPAIAPRRSGGAIFRSCIARHGHDHPEPRVPGRLSGARRLGDRITGSDCQVSRQDFAGSLACSAIPGVVAAFTARGALRWD